MTASVEWRGLDVLEGVLRRFPDLVEAQARPIVRGAAQEHYRQVTARFPQRDDTGTLRRRTQLVEASPLAYRVRNTARHSHLYEFGFGHASGREVSGHDVYVPAAVDIRERMVQQLGEVPGRVARMTGGVLEAR